MRDSLIVRISFAFIFPFMLIAMVISLTGFRGPIQLDDTFMSFMRRIAFESSSWHISIPNIPYIPKVAYFDYFNAQLVDFLNVLVGIGNFLVTVCNWAINFMNLIIGIFTFLIALIKMLYQFKDVNYSSAGPLTWWVTF